MAVPSGLAQDTNANAAVQQSQNLTQPSGTGPRITPDGIVLPDASASSDEAQSDEDLGEQWMLKHNQRLQPLTVFADVSAFYTSNVALTHTPEFHDSFLVGSVGASYARPFAKIWAFNIGLNEALFRYNTHDEFDFDSFNVSAGVSVQARSLGNTNFSLQYNYSRLTEGLTSGELFNGHSFTVSAIKVVQLSSADSLSLGLSGAFNLAEPSSLQTASGGFFTSYNLGVTRRLSLGLNYRMTVFTYTDVSRIDLNQAFSAGLHYNLNRWFSINASVSAIFNSSNVPAFDYKALNLGGGISGNIRF